MVVDDDLVIWVECGYLVGCVGLGVVVGFGLGVVIWVVCCDIVLE